ncbi:glycosyltransferase family 2 protein [Desulfogranum japonicum]|uniref:glycosyltransferase family 2 protein n=1 Tax=Desulfogranum japonicum TaxID=231447 RepID=UPI00042A5366|nr:glycosyltransferase family 2 protein [Desulfogranum japonicum]
MQAVIIIPVYNHESRVSSVVEQSLATGLPIIVVDDGSTDSTRKRLHAFDTIQVLHHANNHGKGAALLTGFRAAAEKGFSWAITLDGDGQHLPSDALNLLNSVHDNERCIVLGRRLGMNQDGNVPWTSRFGRGFSNFWVWVSGGPRVSDSQSGFRIYPLPEILQLHVKARRYQYEVEVLVKAKRNGIPTREADVHVVYQPPGVRISHFRPWVDFMRNSATFSRLICARIFGQGH